MTSKAKKVDRERGLLPNYLAGALIALEDASEAETDTLGGHYVALAGALAAMDCAQTLRLVAEKLGVPLPMKSEDELREAHEADRGDRGEEDEIVGAAV